MLSIPICLSTKTLCYSWNQKLELLEAVKAAEVGDLTQKLVAETAKVDSSQQEIHTLKVSQCYYWLHVCMYAEEDVGGM